MLAIVYTLIALVPVNNRIKIVGEVHSASRLEDISAQMGYASPLACCTPHDSFRDSNLGIR